MAFWQRSYALNAAARPFASKKSLAIQGLYQMLRSKEDEIESLRDQLQLQQDDNMALNTKVETMERLLMKWLRKNSEGTL